MDEPAVEARRELAAAFRDAGDELGRRLEPVGALSGVDPLGGVREGEVLSEPESRQPFHDRADDLLGRPRVRRRFEHDQPSRRQREAHLFRGELHHRQVGRGVLQGCGNADQQDVGVAEHGRIGPEPRLVEPGDLRVGEIDDRGALPIQGRDLVGVGVVADHREPGVVDRDEQRQTHVAEPDHADDGVGLSDPRRERHERVGVEILREPSAHRLRYRSRGRTS